MMQEAVRGGAGRGPGGSDEAYGNGHCTMPLARRTLDTAGNKNGRMPGQERERRYLEAQVARLRKAKQEGAGEKRRTLPGKEGQCKRLQVTMPQGLANNANAAR